MEDSSDRPQATGKTKNKTNTGVGGAVTRKSLTEPEAGGAEIIKKKAGADTGAIAKKEKEKKKGTPPVPAAKAKGPKQRYS